MNDEFFALCRLCRSKGKKENPVPRNFSSDRGLRYLQTTDELGAQVALLQSPIPPAVELFYQLTV